MFKGLELVQAGWKVEPEKRLCGQCGCKDVCMFVGIRGGDR